MKVATTEVATNVTNVRWSRHQLKLPPKEVATTVELCRHMDFYFRQFHLFHVELNPFAIKIDLHWKATKLPFFIRNLGQTKADNHQV